ncbi:MAG: hypothetical protein M4579_000780 [Chaenotheca gracillima]|nr:MAG: hypothetical protein M4579_000780 [Chaenotheca gracillima]
MVTPDRDKVTPASSVPAWDPGRQAAAGSDDKGSDSEMSSPRIVFAKTGLSGGGCGKYPPGPRRSLLTSAILAARDNNTLADEPANTEDPDLEKPTGALPDPDIPCPSLDAVTRQDPGWYHRPFPKNTPPPALKKSGYFPASLLAKFGDRYGFEGGAHGDILHSVDNKPDIIVADSDDSDDSDNYSVWSDPGGYGPNEVVGKGDCGIDRDGVPIPRTDSVLSLVPPMTYGDPVVRRILKPAPKVYYLGPSNSFIPPEHRAHAALMAARAKARAEGTREPHSSDDNESFE